MNHFEANFSPHFDGKLKALLIVNVLCVAAYLSAYDIVNITCVKTVWGFLIQFTG